MNRRWKWYVLLLAAGGFVLTPPFAFGQGEQESRSFTLPSGQDQPPPKEDGPIKLTLRPAAPPIPPLKYQFLPEVTEQTPANAALHYHRANLLKGRLKPGMGERMANWQEMPLNELPIKEVKEFLGSFSDLFRELDRAAACERCDWGLMPLLNQEGLSVLLPEIQELRGLAQFLALRARLFIIERQWDKAIQTIRTGFVLARHAGDAPTLICSLVSSAIAAVMTQRLEELIQAEASPNLYWALTILPRPFVDMPRAMQGEKVYALNMFPTLPEAEERDLTQPELRALVDRLEKLAGGEGVQPGGSQLLAVAWAVTAYPEAKRHLVARGRPADQVESMPVLQAVLLHSFHQYNDLREEMLKWCYLPYHEARPHLVKLETRLRVERGQSTVMVLAALLLPAVNRIYLATTRLDRRIAVLRVIEAIRLYAAAHAGKLPATLDDIKEVPVPSDPITGKPFTYGVTGDTATLFGPAPTGEPARFAVNYQLRMQR